MSFTEFHSLSYKLIFLVIADDEEDMLEHYLAEKSNTSHAWKIAKLSF